MALGERLFRRYSEEQLGLLLEFTREGRELNEREAAKLEARTRAQRGGELRAVRSTGRGTESGAFGPARIRAAC